MKVSIIINTYNRAKQLQDCLRGLWNLDYPEFEVIVVNGPSTDNTKEVCSRFSESITYVECSERNLSISRNIGLANARGEIVAFIDDDAVVDTNWLKNIVAGYSSDEIYGVGGFTIDHTGKKYQATTTICDRLGEAYSVPSGVSTEVYQFSGTGFFVSLLGTNSSFRLSAMKKIGGFDETFAYFLDETDVCARLVDLGGKIIYTPEAIIYHRYAPSHLRNPNKVPTTLYVTARSKAYFMCRHGKPLLGERRVEDAMSLYQSNLRRDNAWLSKHGHMSEGAAALLNLDVERGIEDGRSLSQDPAPTNLALRTEESISRDFKPFSNPFKDALRIVLVSQGFPPKDTSGIARWTSHVAYGLAKRGHQVHVVTKSHSVETVDYNAGVWVHNINSTKSSEFNNLTSQLDIPSDILDWSVAVYEEIRRIGFKNIDLVSAPIWDVEGLVTLMLAPVPVVTSLHTTYKLALPYKPNWHRALYKLNHVDKIIKAEKFIFENCASFLGNTHAVVREIDESYQSSIEARTRVVAHGVDDPIVGTIEQTKQPTILFVGRQESRKGFDTALEAAALVCAVETDVLFRFIGSETDDQDCLAAVKKYHGGLPVEVKNRISLEGYVTDDDLQQAYRECTIFLAPSRFESFGLIAIEAMRYAKPVIVGNVGGLVEVVDHEKTGILVNPSDAREIAAVIQKLLNNPKFANKIGAAAEKSFREKFTVDKMIDGIESTYRHILNEKKFDNKMESLK
ncbi:glycosyltransferase involved in cell wall biosynthesis/GT2 family glycosyltransferase [Massilia sp. MP_M2]|uniref:glycosyltransferase n=1 Tax=Massilia sp. MP_M2 TaxID=3071713 RepID=UPI00319E9F16